MVRAWQREPRSPSRLTRSSCSGSGTGPGRHPDVQQAGTGPASSTCRSPSHALLSKATGATPTAVQRTRSGNRGNNQQVAGCQRPALVSFDEPAFEKGFGSNHLDWHGPYLQLGPETVERWRMMLSKTPWASANRPALAGQLTP